MEEVIEIDVLLGSFWKLHTLCMDWPLEYDEGDRTIILKAMERGYSEEGNREVQ